MHIHFVCTGNVFRSRLAEAYLNSKHIPSLRTSSSGVSASVNSDGPVTWYAANVLRKKNLVPFMSTTWQDTTKELLDDADYVVFMTDSHLQKSIDEIGWIPQKYAVWNVIDTHDHGLSPVTKNHEEDIKVITMAENTYDLICEKADLLLEELHVE